MCSSCSTQKHVSPHGLQQGVAFTPYQYAKHVENQRPSNQTEVSQHSSTMRVNSIHYPTPANHSLFYNVFPPFIPNIPYQPPQNVRHFDCQLWKPFTWENHPSPHNLAMAISALLFLNHNIPQKASRILHPELSFLIESSISHSGGIFDSKIKICKDISTTLKNIGLEPTLEAYVFCPERSFLNGMASPVQNPLLKCQTHLQPHNHDPPCVESLGHMVPSTHNQAPLSLKFIPKKNLIY
ncbi:hypothetical protein O181_058628 [Austropuccinia psidii MF-1]|uniref:Uncharacterized protein n=1 Tax=Austropuccinia psidii MF-1 TaxID=1389203 RepID=A0A9Q3EDE1_9BASI|nr:hypothetical protein [Austropuccinia psidii MF-1]